jgi:hypothetical protein
MKRDYSSYSESIKRAEALKDLREWFGDRYEGILADFRAVHAKHPLSFNRVELYLSVAGVYGYPVVVFYKEMTNAS